jgi:hypothetical protein
MIIRVRRQAMPNEKENIFSRELADPGAGIGPGGRKNRVRKNLV